MGRTIRRKVDKFTTFIGLHRRRKKAAPPDSGAEACDQAKVPEPPRVAAREVISTSGSGSGLGEDDAPLEQPEPAAGDLVRQVSLEDPPRQPPNWAAATAIQQDERRSVPEWTTAAADTDLAHQRAVPVQVEVVEVVEAEVEAAEVEAEAEVKAAEAEVAEVQVVFDEEEKEPPATSAPSETAAASALHERPPEHASLKTPRQAYVEEVCAGRIDGTAAGAAALLLPAAAALDEARMLEPLLCRAMPVPRPCHVSAPCLAGGDRAAAVRVRGALPRGPVPARHAAAARPRGSRLPGGASAAAQGEGRHSRLDHSDASYSASPRTRPSACASP